MNINEENDVRSSECGLKTATVYKNTAGKTGRRWTEKEGKNNPKGELKRAIIFS